MASLLNGIAVVRHVPTVAAAGIPHKDGTSQRFQFELSAALALGPALHDSGTIAPKHQATQTRVQTTSQHRPPSATLQLTEA